MAVRSRSPLKRAVTFHIPLGLLVGATLFPFYWMVITSVRPDVELYNVKMNPFFTLHPTLTHFYYLFELTMFPRWAWNTLFIATVSTGISLFCGLLAGYALARLQFRWAPPLGTMIFITYLVPPTLEADRKSTRLNSSHLVISYAVFCLKKKKKIQIICLSRQKQLYTG